MEDSTEQIRSLGVGEYLRMLRRQWLVIALIAVVAGGAALAYSLRQPSVYQAQSSVAFEDLSRDLDIVGIPTPAAETGAEIAAQNVNLVISSAVLARASRLPGIRGSAKSLSSMVSAQVQPTSPLVTITAESNTAQGAARLANAVALQAVIATNKQARAMFRTAQHALVVRLGGRGAPVSRASRQSLLNEVPRLQSLSTFATGASVAATATPPAAPSSPKPVRNTALGLMLGLLLGLIAALIRDSLDRRVESARDLEHLWSFPVVGHLRKDALGRIAYRSQDRSEHEVDLDLEAHRIVRGNLELLDSRAALRSVIVTSSIPEEGKTTVSASLAMVNAAAGKRTLLVECNLRRPVLAMRLDLAPQPGLIELLRDEATLQEILQVVSLSDRPSDNGASPEAPRRSDNSLACITAGGSQHRPAELLESDRFHQFLERVTRTYEMVVVDTSPLLAVVDTLQIVPYADAIVMCVRAQRATRDQVAAARTILGRLPEKPTAVVLTGARSRGDQAYGPYPYQYA